MRGELGLFVNRGQRGTFGPEREELTGNWREVHNKELHNLYCPLDIVRVIRPRMRWTRRVANMGEGTV
jgi:hypothetical protein